MGKVRTIEPRNKVNVYYVAEMPVDVVISHHLAKLDDNHPYFPAVKASIAEVGVLYPVFAQCIQYEIMAAVGKQRIEACRQLGLETCPMVIDDYDNTFRTTEYAKDAIKIVDTAHGQTFFSDDYVFNMDRFVSVKKKHHWRDEYGEARFYEGQEAASDKRRGRTVSPRSKWEP